MAVGVMICYARSGGTLLNKCLGVMPNTIVLSEVSNILDHSAEARRITPSLFPAWQARNWFGIEIADSVFPSEVKELAGYCEANGKALIVRDWSFLSFSKIDVLGNKPPLQLVTVIALGDMELRPFAFVRNAIDVWISRGKPPIEEFSGDYLKYADAIVESGMPVVHYEDFCANPSAVMKTICQIVGIGFDEGFIYEYKKYHFVVGDEQVIGGSRGGNKSEITLLPRKKLSQKELVLLQKNAAINRANQLLGYSQEIEVKIESLAERYLSAYQRTVRMLTSQGVSAIDGRQVIMKTQYSNVLEGVVTILLKGDSLFSKRIYAFIKESSWILIGQALLLLGSLFGVKLMTAILAPQEYGELALGLTVAALATQVLFGPLVNGVTRFYAPAKERGDISRFFNTVHRLMVWVSVAILLMIVLLTFAQLIVGYSEWIPLSCMSLIFALLGGYNSALNGIQNAARHRSIVAIHQGVEPWLRFLTAAGLILLLGANSEIAMLGYILAASLVLMSQYAFFRKMILKNVTRAENPTDWMRQILLYSWPFAAWGIFSWAQQVSDRWALSLFSTTHEVGLYAVLFQLGYYPMSLATTLATQFLAPIFYQQAGDASDGLRNAKVSGYCWRLTWIVLVATGMTFLAAMMWHKQAFGFFVAQEYSSVSDLWPWVLLAGGVFAAGQTLALGIMSQMRTYTMAAAKILTALLGIGLNFVGAYTIGITGVVTATVVFTVAHLVWMAWLARRMDVEMVVAVGRQT